MMDFLVWTFRLLGTPMAIITLIPFIKNDHWTFRVFEFPRAQKLAINSAIFILGTFAMNYSSQSYDTGLLITLAAVIIYLIYQIYPFLPFAKKQVFTFDGDEKSNIKMLISNVYQYNKSFTKLDKLVKTYDPDLVMMVETDKWWKDKAEAAFGKNYEYKVLHDLENTYGMLVYSKFRLEGTRVRHLIKEEVPSIITDIILPNDYRIRFFGIHPEPPVPSENPKSTARDAEILKVGKEAQELNMPVIIAGDLNDVAWSYTTDLFLKVSGLRDPRRGRGFFNTFHAKYFLLRWPLDHIFCSEHFRVKNIKRLPSIDSDHFPMYIELAITDDIDNGESMEADSEEKQEAEEKIEAAL